MKYFSEVTNKTYDTVEALEKAELTVKNEKNERAAAAAKVNEKLKVAREAQKEANDAIHDFCEKYGTFKTSLKRDEIFDPFSLLFDPFEF